MESPTVVTLVTQLARPQLETSEDLQFFYKKNGAHRAKNGRGKSQKASSTLLSPMVCQ